MAGWLEREGHKTVVVHEYSSSHEKAIRDAVQERANARAYGSSDMRYLGEITPFQIHEYINKAGITWDQFFANPEHARRVLNAAENSAMRVWKGRV